MKRKVYATIALNMPRQRREPVYGIVRIRPTTTSVL
jgi:hypothetical protein